MAALRLQRGIHTQEIRAGTGGWGSAIGAGQAKGAVKKNKLTVTVMPATEREVKNIPADLLVEMVLFLLDDGDGDRTAVLFLLAGDADLLFEAVLLDDLGGRGGRESGLGGERRVLTYPSSWGNLDLDLLVGFGLGSGLGLPVGRREDAERDRDAGFKVQVAGLLGARNNLLDVRQEDISC